MGGITDDAALASLLKVFVAVLILLIAVQWLAWIFALGRWRKDSAPDAASSGVGTLFASAFLRLFDNFRHLLAMMVVLIFAAAVIWVLVVANGNVTNIKDGLQVVVATLGGLVGSILGYYFGESRGRDEGAPTAPTTPKQTPAVPGAGGNGGAGGTGGGTIPSPSPAAAGTPAAAPIVPAQLPPAIGGGGKPAT